VIVLGSVERCRSGFYARFYREQEAECYECLEEHLALTAFLSIATYLKLRQSIIRFKEGRKHIAELKKGILALLAGLFHDIAKSFDIYQKTKEIDRMSFSKPPHEELSAITFEYIVLGLWPRLKTQNPINRVVEECFPEESKFDDCTLCYYVYIPIRYHHQGLRLILRIGEQVLSQREYYLHSQVYNNLQNAIKVLTSASYILRELLSIIEMRKEDILPKETICILRVLSEVLSKPISITTTEYPKCNMNCYPEEGEVAKDLSRLFTGSLILADYAATITNLSRLNKSCISITSISRDVILFLNTVLRDIYINVIGYSNIK